MKSSACIGEMPNKSSLLTFSLLLLLLRRSAFFDMRVCHPNAESYKELTPKQICRVHENEKKRVYNQRVTDIEQGTFTPLIFTTTRGMGEECEKYHS